MAEILIINETCIKKYTHINDAVDAKLLYPAIYLAQDKYLMPYLGTNLYNKIKDDILNNTLSGNYQILVDDYCRKVVLWWTMVEAYPHLVYKLDNSSLVTRTSDDSQVVSSDVYAMMLDKAKQNAEHYLNLMIDYLCYNNHLFPEYSNNTFPARAPIQFKQGSLSYRFSNGNTATSQTRRDIRLDQIP